MRLEYRSICTEKTEHAGKELELSGWAESEDEPNAAGKKHELETKGHRWKLEAREKPA
jgi:hypothetical protein